MSQNIYDDPDFFHGYSTLDRSVHGLSGAPEWNSLSKMLPDMNNSNVVDLGCGYGWFCREARKRGASNVLGLDISTKMLDRAREMTDDESIIYKQEDLETLVLEEGAYDLAYSSLVVHYIVNLNSMFDTVYKSLKPNGLFVFTAEHPITTAPNKPGFKAGWINIREDGRRSFPIDSYHMEGPRVEKWFVEGVVRQHRMMETYFNLLIEKGFVLKYVEEWKPEEELERPMFMLVSAMKPGEKKD